MLQNFRVHLLILTLILIAGLAVPVSAGLVLDWKEHPTEGNPYTGVAFSADGSVVYAGGSQMLLRSWDGERKWGGKAGTAAAMSADSNYVISGNGDSVVMYDKDGVDLWTRNFDKHVRAVAISANGSFIVEADDSGLIQSWARNGEFIGRNSFDPTKAISISRDGSLVVVATDGGLKFLTPGMNLIWEDTKNGNWDTFIAISEDGSTIITAGGTRVSSHTANGQLNWMKDFTTGAITDLACSGDCSVIVIGSETGGVQVINRYGVERWNFSKGQWINAVGISRNGQVIAVGSLDRTLYALDGSGKVTSKVTTTSNIRERSVAVNRDGSRIVASDDLTLYGYNLKPEQEMTLPPRTATPYFTATTTIATPSPTATEEITEVPTPEPTPTKSGPGPAIAIIATAGIILVMARKKA
jgi:WD40 repeat protein